jgi:hypothetical protein
MNKNNFWVRWIRWESKLLQFVASEKNKLLCVKDRGKSGVRCYYQHEARRPPVPVGVIFCQPLHNYEGVLPSLVQHDEAVFNRPPKPHEHKDFIFIHAKLTPNFRF